MLELLPSPFAPRLEQFLDNVESSLLLCSPYITFAPVEYLVEVAKRKKISDSIRVQVLTDISPANLVNNSTDIKALIYLAQHLSKVEVTYLPRIHAKVYVSGASEAIVSSANFTRGGGTGNLEYGVAITQADLVRQITDDITQYLKLGSAVSIEQLHDLKERVEQLRAAIGAEQRSIRAQTRALAAQLRRETEDSLLRVRTSGRTTHAIFAETLVYLLSKGDTNTIELHKMIQEIHPDLCDDLIDRVIDGKRFGKFWKHEVRSAQTYLKRKGSIEYDAGSRLWKQVK